MLKQKNKNTRLKRGSVELIILWIFIFVSFVSIFFLIIDYGNIMRIKGNLDMMGDYAARKISIGENSSNIIESLNNMKSSYFSTILNNDLVCENTGINNNQVVLIINGEYLDTKVLNVQNNIIIKKVVYNEISSEELECTLDLKK
jgi:hypothetical protein